MAVGDYFQRCRMTDSLKITVAVVTRNRADHLLECLGSLLAQSISPAELLIIDNASSDDTRLIASNFKSGVSFPVRYHLEKKIGYGSACNAALRIANGSWLAFIDDDCVVPPNWYQQVCIAVRQYRGRYQAVLGTSSTYYAVSSVSLARNFIDSLGKIRGVRGEQVDDLEILDAKSTVYDIEYIRRKKIAFPAYNDPSGWSADCDVGMQLEVAGAKARLYPQIEVYHKDPPRLKSYYSKLFAALRGHYKYEQRWCEYRGGGAKLGVSDTAAVFRIFTRFRRQYQLNWTQSISLLCHIAVTILSSKLYRIWLRFN